MLQMDLSDSNEVFCMCRQSLSIHKFYVASSTAQKFPNAEITKLSPQQTHTIVFLSLSPRRHVDYLYKVCTVLDIINNLVVI